jgi:hypothetical protein
LKSPVSQFPSLHPSNNQHCAKILKISAIFCRDKKGVLIFNKNLLHQPNHTYYKQTLHHHFSFNNIALMDKNPPGMHADKGENAWKRSNY